MRKLTQTLQQCTYLLLFICVAKIAQGQNPPLELKNFAIWGGGASPSPYISTQGVFIKNNVNIQGNIGSNHLVDIEINLTLTGNIYSGNRVFVKNNAAITGNIFANRMGTTLSPSISGGTNNVITGNLTANGKITLISGQVIGSVAVTAPANTNYTGPVPSGGVGTNFTLPVMPSMPNNTPFDNPVGTTNITNTQTISPGIFGKLALTGNKTITFNGPGNYIFYEIDNGTTSNKFIFDLKNTSTGTINLFIIKDVNLGKLSVSTVNGNFPSRIYTEVHGDGSTFSGNSFNLQGTPSLPAGSNVWLGNVWAPNGAISITNPFTSNPSTTPDIIGALWSGKSVTLNNNIRLVYVAPANVPSYIDPYYPPPVGGKVNTANNIIGAELFSLSQNTAPITSITQNEIFVLDNAGKVMIEVVSKTPNNTILRQQLINLGMTGLIDNGPHIYTITGFFPINNLQQLNSNLLIQYVRPLYPPISNAGQVTTQGDTTMRSHNVKARFGLDGTGVKIGVLSDSYNSKLVAENDVVQGDLPGASNPNNTEPVQVLADTKGNDEGRAMLQIVHDVAPKSKLAFRTGFLSAGDFAKGILELASPTLAGGRCDVIVDDITYITEPFLQDGVVAQTVDQVAAQGVTYFSSAGNFGNKSYENNFAGVTNTSVIPTGQIHKFGATDADIYQTLNLKPGSYTIVLQWNDEFRSLGSTNGVQTDMDLYLVGTTGFTLFGFNRSNLFGDPFEVCPFTVKEETNAKLMVVRAAGTGNVRFKYIIFRGDGTILDYPAGASSIVGHPNAEGAIAVGAMLYANFPQFTPVWPGVASFSSRGGTSTLKNSSFVTRNKPELVGPNGTNTTVNLGGAVFNDGDAYPNFFGTSAAAPHVAAVGALLIQGRKKFALQTTVTPSEIRAHLQSSAGKFLNQGNFSFEGGYGYVQADSAVQQIANARPIIDTLMAVVPGSQNGNRPFQVKIKGKYLTSSTQVYCKGRPVATNVSADKTEATATVDSIPAGQDPPFQLFNAAKSQSGLDGGLSEALYFFSAKIDVTVKAVNKSRKYGQANPTFTVDVWINGVPINQTNITLAALKLDGNNITYTTIATAASNAGLYGIFPSRTTPLALNDPLLTQYGFTFLSGTLSVGKMPLKITPQNKQIKYGEYPGDIVYNYELTQSPADPTNLLQEVKALHKKYLADNALVVINGFNSQNPVDTTDLLNMSTMASFQSVRNARKFVLQNGRLQPLDTNISPSQIGDQRFIVDVSAQSLANYKLNPANSAMVTSLAGSHARGLLNLKALTNGTARASLSEGQPIPMVNGQLLAMVNGQLQALVNGQLQALVNGVTVPVQDLVFQNGQLVALVNGGWVATTNGQLQALVNGQQVTVNLSIVNGQLQAIVNGQLMALVNGQLQAIVNGQTLSIVNGQLQALVNGQLMPLVNGQLQAMVNGQLQAMVNGQLVALVNGQLMALVNGELQIVQELTLVNGQLQALVNGQLQALVNGQLQAMVNGVVTNIPNANITLVNGQLQAMVNGQLQALVNGQLQALVNGQLQPLVNGAAVAVQSVRQLVNGQLQALVNGTSIPIANGQLQALVNGQLLAMVNGQLMALVNGELTFAVFSNGQLQALVNGQLQALVNGQLQAMVNGQLQALVNNVNLGVDNSYRIVNGQLQALVNGQTWAYANGQLLALVNGQLQALVNNFDVSGTNNNAKTLVLVDQDDITKQSGDVGGMFAMNMITGLNAGTQTLIPGGFVNENFEVTYGLGQVEILKAPLIAKANDTTKVYGDPNPAFRVSYSGFAYGEGVGNITAPTVSCNAVNNSPVNTYPITLEGGSSANYTVILQNGQIAVTKKALTISADNKSKIFGSENPPLTLSFNGLVNGDSETNVCGSPIVANTSVNTSTPTGVYPITIQVCNSPNYNITYTNGTFTVSGVAPSINCPANITVNNDPGQCGAIVNFAATETTGNPASTISYSPASGSLFPVGITTVTATATNAVGSSLCTFTVTVRDNQAPVLTGVPANVTVQCNGDIPQVTNITVTDNCSNNLIPVYNQSIEIYEQGWENGTSGWSATNGYSFELVDDPSSPFPPKVHKITQAGAGGNYFSPFIDVQAGRTYIVSGWIKWESGNTPFIGIDRYNSASGYIGENWLIGGQNYVDNFGGAVTNISSIGIGWKFYSKTFTAPAGTSKVKIKTELFSGQSKDGLLPIGYFDNISIGEVITNLPTTTGNKVIKRTWTATDAAGNFTTGTQTVTVRDNQAPTAVCKPVTVYLNANGIASITANDINNGSTDNCSNTLNLSISRSTFNCSDISSTQSIVTDSSWKESSIYTPSPWPGCNGNIVWSGVSSLPSANSYTINPTIYSYATVVIPGTQGLFNLNDVRYYRKQFNLTSLNGIKATLQASVDNAVQIFINGTSVALEANPYVANFTDSIFHRVVINTVGSNINGGTGYQSFDDITTTNASNLFIVGTNEIVLAVANCEGDDRGAVSFKADIETNSGRIPVVLTVSDNNGNASSCTAIVTVIDNIAPTITCPANITVNSSTPVVVNYTTPVGTDNCTGATTTRIAGLASGATFPMGTTTVTHRVTDASGLTATCSFTVTVEEPCLQHHWKADGNFADSKGNATGNNVGGVTFSNGFDNSIGNSSFNFTNTPSYISLGTSGSVPGTGDFSVSAWVKTLPVEQRPMVIIQQRDGNVNGEYILKIGGWHGQQITDPYYAGRAYFLIYEDATPVLDLFSNTLVNDGNWHKIKGERVGTTIKLYVDDVQEATGNTSIVVNLKNTITTTIGRDIRDNGSQFYGQIDDIRVSICPTSSIKANNSGTAANSLFVSEPVTDKDSKPYEDKIYPNPAHSTIRLQLKDDVQSVNDIRMYDGVGKLTVLSSRRINTGLYEINVSGLSPGIYIIQAKTAAGLKTFKFIKL